MKYKNSRIDLPGCVDSHLERQHRLNESSYYPLLVKHDPETRLQCQHSVEKSRERPTKDRMFMSQLAVGNVDCFFDSHGIVHGEYEPVTRKFYVSIVERLQAPRLPCASPTRRE